MKLRRMAVSTALALGLFTLGAGAARAQSSFAAGVHIGPSGRASVDLAFFHSDLAPYGRWVDVSAYGHVFVPRHHHRHWRPYMYGHWVYTDYGWTWVSSEPFGWATYHYGRWVYDPDYGWAWVPGTTWGPAWVDWQESANYVGWAPLPPSVGYDASAGLDYGSFDPYVDLAPESYVYVPQQRFLVADVASYAVPPERCAPIFDSAQSITNYQVYNNRVVDQPFPVTQVERFTGQRVPRFQLADLPAADPLPRIRGNQLALFRPQVTAPAAALTAERIAARSVPLDAPARLAERRGVRAQIAAFRGAQAATQYDQSVQRRAAAGLAGRQGRFNPQPGGRGALQNQQQATLAPRGRQGNRFQNDLRQQAALDARGRQQNGRFQSQPQATLDARGRQNGRFQNNLRQQAALDARGRQQNGRFQSQPQATLNARGRQNGRFQNQRFQSQQQATLDARARQNGRFQNQRQQAALDARGRQNGRFQNQRGPAGAPRQQGNARQQQQALRQQQQQFAPRQQQRQQQQAARQQQQFAPRQQQQAWRRAQRQQPAPQPQAQAWRQQQRQQQAARQQQQFAPRQQQAWRQAQRQQVAPPQPPPQARRQQQAPPPQQQAWRQQQRQQRQAAQAAAPPPQPRRQPPAQGQPQPQGRPNHRPRGGGGQ